MAQTRSNEVPVQFTNFDEPGYVAICRSECAGATIEPQNMHTLTRQNTVSVDGVKETGQVTETYTEARLFTVARNAALGIKAFKYVEDNEPFLDILPNNVGVAARNCASVILADQCPKFYSADGALRLRR